LGILRVAEIVRGGVRERNGNKHWGVPAICGGKFLTIGADYIEYKRYAE
jgi:hypothetical protein